MATTPVTSALQYINEFRKIVGDAYVLTDDESVHKYAHDETETLH